MNPAHLPSVQTKVGKFLAKKATFIALFLILILLRFVWTARSPASVSTVQIPTQDRRADAAGAGGGAAARRHGDDTGLRIFVGVMTMAGKYELRHHLRLVNALQKPELPPGVHVDVMFVFCRLTTAEQKAMVAAEILYHNDIFILDCPHENMDNGKTYRFFSAVSKIFKNNDDPSITTNKTKPQNTPRPPYDYVMKADDDTYLRLASLAASLAPLPRHDLYYGFQVDAGQFLKTDPPFMAGMGYAVSWDLVQWIATWEPWRRTAVGFEDRVVGKWLIAAGKGKNIYDTKPPGEYWGGGTVPTVDNKYYQYDLPIPPLKFLQHTVSVHRVKTYADWTRVLSGFNVTAKVTSSRFYDIKLNFGRVG